VEMLVALAIFGLLLVVAGSMVNMISTTYQRIGGKIDIFEAARHGFDTMNRTLRQATLCPYIDYNDPKAPTRYVRKSDLHFICGSMQDLGLPPISTGYSPQAIFLQAPLGLADSASLQTVNGTLCNTGFYLAFDEDPDQPDIPQKSRFPKRFRFRLMQLLMPTESVNVYDYTVKTITADGTTLPVSNDSQNNRGWFSNAVGAKTFSRTLAENVVALVILPIINGQPAASYLYDTRNPDTPSNLHQLPQALKVVMVVIDEQSALRLENGEEPPSLIPAGLFESPANFDADFIELERSLAMFAPKVSFQVFVSDIPIQTAPWHL